MNLNDKKYSVPIGDGIRLSKAVKQFRKKFNSLILERKFPIKALELLHTIVLNIHMNPTERKYRAFKRTATVITYLETDSGKELLNLIGFSTKVEQMELKWVINDTSFIWDAVQILETNIEAIKNVEKSHLEKIKYDQQQKKERVEKVLLWIEDDRGNVEDRKLRALTVSKKPLKREDTEGKKLGTLDGQQKDHLFDNYDDYIHEESSL